MSASSLFDLYGRLWFETYGMYPSVIVSTLDFGKLGIHRKAMTDAQLGSALAGYFETDNPLVLKRRHPLGLFLCNPTQYLPLPAKQSGSLCSHSPRCDSFAQCTRLTLESGRAVVK